MIRTATQHDLPALRELFSRANETPYDLAAVAGEKCFGAGIAGEPVVKTFNDDGRVVAAAVTCGRWLRLVAVDPDWRRKGIGTALLADAEMRGCRVIAAEPGNYFTPGVVATDVASRAFFAARGYTETRQTTNLHVDLESVEPTDGVHRPYHDDAERVLAFVEREFGSIWRFETAKAFDCELPSIFVAEVEGELTGFAAHDVNNRGLGFFGPTGVAGSVRGRGIGCRLLRASLADLRRLGHERAVIPWTDALEFYRKCCGAEPAHQFVTLARRE